MKIKKILTIFISLALISIPLEVFSWLSSETYFAYNRLNMCISGIMRISTFFIVITYITLLIRYLRYSEHKAKEKIKNILIWLIITIVQIAILVFGSILVLEVGVEEFSYRTGKMYQVNDIRGFFSSLMRMTALASAVAYIIVGISYFVKSKEDRNQKIKILIKLQIIVAIILLITLPLAKIL